MPEFIEDYLKKGLSRIVLTDDEFKESRDGMQEWGNETIVAYDGQRFVEVCSSYERRYRPAGFSGGVGTPCEITEEEYNQRAAGKQIVDTPEFYARRAARAEKNKQIEAARESLKKEAPNCPKCGNSLTPRKGPTGKFWGCKSYPDCKGTAQFSSRHHALSEIASQSSL